MKKIIMTIALLLAIGQTFAQTDPLREKMDSIFQHVNKALIPTGYLKENGAEQMPIHCYNGLLTDSNSINNHSPPAHNKLPANLLYCIFKL